MDILAQISTPLLHWYDTAARILPWREQPTAYRVWISEIMLQQTRVEAVKPYFERFIAALPDVRSLAEISESQLLKLWEGLGYYNRARNLQKTARILLKEYGGELPASFDALLSLPGIGPYTAGAIASIAYNLPVPAVDGNVLRVTARLLSSADDIADPKVKSRREHEIKAILPSRAGDFNQALMELGATVCLPNGKPHCEQCPLSALCSAHLTGRTADFPVKLRTKRRREEERTLFLLTCGRRLALLRRPDEGLLAGLWELPSVPEKLSLEGAQDTLFDWDIQAGPLTPLPESKHIFTHLVWKMTAFTAETFQCSPRFCWVSPEEFQTQYPLPHAFKAYFPEIHARLGLK